MIIGFDGRISNFKYQISDWMVGGFVLWIEKNGNNLENYP